MRCKLLKQPHVFIKSISLSTIKFNLLKAAYKTERMAGKMLVLLPCRRNTKLTIALFFKILFKNQKERCQGITDPALASLVGSSSLHLKKADGGLTCVVIQGRKDTNHTTMEGWTGPQPRLPPVYKWVK